MIASVSDFLSALAVWIWQTTWQGAVLICLTAAMLALIGRWLTPKWRFAIWMLVVVRLLMPMTPQSSFSLFNLAAWLAAAPSSATAESVIQLPLSAPQLFVHYLPSEVSSVYPIQTSEQASAPAPRRIWRHWLASVWLIGIGLCVIRMSWSQLSLARRIRRRAPDQASARSLALLSRCCHEMKLRRCPELCVTDAVEGPVIDGFIRPRLLIPSEMMNGLSGDESRLVFLHELAHLKRRDPLTNILILVAQVLHWFNPLVWYVLFQARCEREQACDALVLSLDRAPPRRRYGRTLLKVAALARENAIARPPFSGAIALIPHESQLRRRIAMIARFRRHHSLAGLVALPMMLAVASCTMTDTEDRRRAEQSDARQLDDVLSVVTVYDLRELAVRVPEFNSGPRLGVQTGHEPFPNAIDASEPDEAATDEIVKLIKTSIHPPRWHDGPRGWTIEVSPEHLLIVTAPQPAQDLVASLLDQLRAMRDVQVTVEARFLTPDLTTLPTAEAKRLQQRLAQLGGSDHVFLSTDEANELLRARQMTAGSTLLTAPRVTLFSGQRAVVVVQTETSFVSDYNVIRSESGETAYDPEVATIADGVVLDVQATASADRKSATLRLRPQLSELLEMQEVSLDPVKSEDLKVQVPLRRTQALDLTVAIPDGQTLLIGGFVHSTGRVHKSRSTTQPAQSVLLLIKPTITSRRDQPAATATTLPAKAAATTRSDPSSRRIEIKRVGN